MSHFLTLLAAAVISLPLAATADSLKAKDVEEFRRNMEACEHLAGEYNPDLGRKERRLFIENTNRYCAKAHLERSKLLKKYGKDDQVAQLAKSESLDSFKAQTKIQDVSYTCDEKTSSFSVGAISSSTPDASTKHIVDASKLTIFGPQTGRWGAPMRMGTGTVNTTCGKLSIQFRGGYLNRDFHGPSGNLDFPVVQIRAGQRLLLDRTAISDCETSNPRTANFGPCPSSWAVSITTREVVPHKFEIVLKRQFSDAREVERETATRLLR